MKPHSANAPRFFCLWLSGLLFLSAASFLRAESAPDPGSFLIASCEGMGVWNRDRQCQFSKYFAPRIGENSPVMPWADMVYDAWYLPSGNYLCSAHEWVREISGRGEVLWEYRVSKPVELKTCVPLADGELMTVDAEKMELLRLAARGTHVIQRIPVPTDPNASPHTRYNLLRRTPAGTFLLALRAEKAFVEVDEQGRQLWKHPVPDLPVVAERLTNGNTLLSWRGGLSEVAPDHQTVWELLPADLPEFPVVIFGGFHRFPNGNTLIVNSDWHYKKQGDNRVQLFEVTREKKVAWKLEADCFGNHKPGSLEPRTGLIEHRIIALQWLGGRFR